MHEAVYFSILLVMIKPLRRGLLERESGFFRSLKSSPQIGKSIRNVSIVKKLGRIFQIFCRNSCAEVYLNAKAIFSFYEVFAVN